MQNSSVQCVIQRVSRLSLIQQQDYRRLFQTETVLDGSELEETHLQFAIDKGINTANKLATKKPFLHHSKTENLKLPAELSFAC